jgi:hypothetical protein
MRKLMRKLSTGDRGGLDDVSPWTSRDVRRRGSWCPWLTVGCSELHLGGWMGLAGSRGGPNLGPMEAVVISAHARRSRGRWMARGGRVVLAVVLCARKKQPCSKFESFSVGESFHFFANKFHQNGSEIILRIEFKEEAELLVIWSESIKVMLW